MSYKYGAYSSGQRWRITRGAPKQHTCVKCGSWLEGADNCQPLAACTRCRQKLYAAKKEEGHER